MTTHPPTHQPTNQSINHPYQCFPIISTNTVQQTRLDCFSESCNSSGMVLHEFRGLEVKNVNKHKLVWYRGWWEFREQYNRPHPNFGTWIHSSATNRENLRQNTHGNVLLNRKKPIGMIYIQNRLERELPSLLVAKDVKTLFHRTVLLNFSSIEINTSLYITDPPNQYERLCIANAIVYHNSVSQKHCTSFCKAARAGSLLQQKSAFHNHVVKMRNNAMAMQWGEKLNYYTRRCLIHTYSCNSSFGCFRNILWHVHPSWAQVTNTSSCLFDIFWPNGMENRFSLIIKEPLYTQSRFETNQRYHHAKCTIIWTNSKES